MEHGKKTKMDLEWAKRESAVAPKSEKKSVRFSDAEMKVRVNICCDRWRVRTFKRRRVPLKKNGTRVGK